MRVLPFVLAIFPLAATAQEEPKGDPAIGRALYTGEQPFEKGGPPCAACHAMGGQGVALAASFGPDLATSKAAQDLDVLDGVMADQPYRTMKPLYAGKPISAQERAHVLAWVREVGSHGPARAGGWIALQAGAAASVLFALFALRGRTRSPREELQARARRIEGGTR